MNRRVLTIIVSDAVESPQWVLVPKSMDFSELLGRLLTLEARGKSAAEQESPEQFLLFDWFGHRLPADIKIGQVPLPGIVVAVLPGGKASRRFNQSGEVDLWLFRQTTMLDETGMDRLSRFLASPDATVPPSPLKHIDAFISYSFQDGMLAATIVRHLESRGLDVFLAESSLSSGQQWRDQIRDAVRSSRRAILLLTRSSLHSSWVLAEAGALASQHTPTIVLFDGVPRDEIPVPLRTAAATEPANQPERWLDVVDHRVQARGGRE